MTDYKQTAVAGTSWQRCSGVSISNPRNDVPMVRMSEEIIAQVNGTEFSQSAPGITFAFDPSEIIELRDPQSGELIEGRRRQA